MEYHIGLEDIEPGNWVAWVFELPGCYARASIRDEAVRLAPEAVGDLVARLTKSGFTNYDAPPPFQVHIVEEFRGFLGSPDYIVNAFFESDKIPLTEKDVAYARHVLGLNRDELTGLVSGLSDHDLDRIIPGEVQKNIRGILRHIGTAEWWYWSRLDMAFPREERPDDVRQLLTMVRRFTLEHLPDLVGRDFTTVMLGETWSPRKLVRRAIWHERVHTLQIARYLTAGEFGNI